MMVLTEKEKGVLRSIINGQPCNHARYLPQVDNCVVDKKEHTGVGFYYYLKVENTAAETERLILSRSEGVLPGAFGGTIGFVLYINNGLLQMLEGFTYEGEMPHDWADRITVFQIVETKDSKGYWLHYP